MISTKRYARIGSFVFWGVLWEFFSRLIDNQVVLPGPVSVFRQMVFHLGSLEGIGAILRTSYRISMGLLIGLGLGIFLGILAYGLKGIRTLIDLPMELIKSTPIASITIILLIWVSYESLTSYIVGLVVLPNIYVSVYSSLDSIDREILEMAQVFRIGFWKSLRYIYFEEIKKSLIPVLIISVGMAFKAGISAEVLALIGESIGEYIYYSKIYLETVDLFAWTLIIVILSKIYQRILVYFLRRVRL